MRYYIIAGEASGDLHASNLMKELKMLDCEAEFLFWGGDKMAQQAGIPPVKHFRELAFMGFLEILMNVRKILKNISFCKKDILDYKPDVLILVDYPGFNLRMAKFSHARGIKVFYYIAPTLWAWHESRIKTIKSSVDKLFVILPFEKEYYKKFGYPVDFAGHPLMDALDAEMLNTVPFEEFLKKNHLEDKPIIAILPGSRKQEIVKIMPLMLSVADDFKNYQFLVAGVSSIPEELYKKYIKDKSNVKLLYNQTYEILKQSSGALVKSGTSTLETALLNIPEVVCYKTSAASYILAKQFIKVKYISIVNLIMNRAVVCELIQHELNYSRVKEELEKILFNTQKRNAVLNEYEQLRQLLGGKGASMRLAGLMYKYLKPE
ncbi:MAG: lipid-A-disaccharide synthase [Bacteroidia bacterium]|nr:lipid-A-disaccharide synthase [Bacteroidia bacterium]